MLSQIITSNVTCKSLFLLHPRKLGYFLMKERVGGIEGNRDSERMRECGKRREGRKGGRKGGRA